ncbi:glycosyltransferase-like protein [Selaginella moellendorffii]|uniref:Glycosyltransferase-like protein n=1 Tax=Selaginella moellendorffii TaxID=88036 RepID=D8RVJ6_SELML|nr:glycosyltransferase-like protein [Selaginella moellendorffii]
MEGSSNILAGALLTIMTRTVFIAREPLAQVQTNKCGPHYFVRNGCGGPLGLSSNIKVYIYDLPSSYNTDWLVDSRCSSHLFAAEVAIHQNLLRSPVRTLDPDEADFFFMPVYVSCNFTSRSGFPTLFHASDILQAAVGLVSRNMPFWDRHQGRDHVFVATHDFGACFHAMEDLAVTMGIPQFLRNSIILQTFGEKNKHPCQNVDHIQIPPYVVPAKKLPDPRSQRRKILAFFRGKMEIHPKNVSGHMYSRGVRTTIWRRFSHDRRFFIKRKRSDNYKAEMLRSVFCLCPLGWAPWSPRIVESVIQGCIPVIIADNIQLPYSHVIDWRKISVTVAERDVHKLDRILSRVAATNVSMIQANLWRDEVRQALVYNQPLVRGDATWQVLDLLSKRKNKVAEAGSRIKVA